jgi:SagB-type dehydrogenase family enzyme
MIPIRSLSTMFRTHCPSAWQYHEHTIRWPHNTLEPAEEPWAEAPFKEYPQHESKGLPPAENLCVSLSDAVRQRLSCRNFLAAPLALSEIGTILWFGNGVEGEVNLGARQLLERPIPSSGGLYPLELYLIARQVETLVPGLYHFAALEHALELLKPMELSAGIVSQLFMNQSYLANASAIVLIAAVLERNMHKYAERGYRYVLLEAGHAAQNMCLAAAGMKLGALPLGGFFDGFLAKLFGLDLEKEILVYGIALGRPATQDRVEIRNVEALMGG